jgi:hypothetical protein
LFVRARTTVAMIRLDRSVFLDRCLAASGTLINALATDAGTAAVPASSGVTLPTLLKVAAAAVALALLTKPLIPLWF